MADSFPQIHPQLLKALVENFPQKDFDTGKSLRDMDFHNGQRSVINFLTHQFEIQNENILTKE
tara:strand:- start:637 stop:825 length:189 start_codon:yes stop_codon:yes gene_type:complete